MVTQDNISGILTHITPGIIQLLMDNRKVTAETASMLLYNSRLYSLLEDEKTKLWHYSYVLLYDMLEEELTTGNITFPEV